MNRGREIRDGHSRVPPILALIASAGFREEARLARTVVGRPLLAVGCIRGTVDVSFLADTGRTSLIC